MDKRTIILLLVMAALAVGSAVPYCSDRLTDRDPEPKARKESAPSRQASSGYAATEPPDRKRSSPFTPSADAMESDRLQRGRDLMVGRCYDTCHSGAVVLEAHKPPQDWPSTIDRMVRYGMKIEPQERQVLIDFLKTLR